MSKLRTIGHGPPDRDRQWQEEGNALLQDCAQQQQLLKQQEMNLTAILQSVIGQHVGGQTDELSRLTCPSCGIKYMEFKAAGRCGCPQDYQVFREPLLPLLERIHRGVKHVGKIPPHALGHASCRMSCATFDNNCEPPSSRKPTRMPLDCAT